MQEKTVTTHHCDWCGKDQEEVFTLIDGPAQRICNECVNECQQLIANRSAAQASGIVPFRRVHHV